MSQLALTLKEMSKLHKVYSLGRGHDMYSFVLEHGVPFSPAPLPEEFPRGEKRRCFENAFLLLMHFSPRLVYVEGFASYLGLPLHHAWLWDRELQCIVDPTWDYDPTQPTQYLGVPMCKDYVVEAVLESERYGVLDRPDFRWPILQADPVTFKQEIQS